MEVSINDILIWLESPKNFESGIGKLNSKEEVSSYRSLMTSILDSSSKGWDKLDSIGLDVTQKTLSALVEKIKKLETHFQERKNYFENNHYEFIGPPYDWDFFLPEGSSEELTKKYKDSYDKQIIEDQNYADYVNQNKDTILLEIQRYLRILNSWNEGLLKQISHLERVFNQSNFEVITVADTNQGRPSSIFLRPIDSNGLYSGLPALLKGLIELDLISNTTALPDIRKIFGFGKVTVKIEWKGSIVALRHFLLELERLGKIYKFEKGKKYIIASQLFNLTEFPDYDFSKLSSNNGRYAKIEELKGLVSNL